MANHKGWDCKDDLKFLRNDDPKFKLSLEYSLLIVYLMIWAKIETSL